MTSLVEYCAPRGTHWEKEVAEAGGAHVFDLPTDPKVLSPWILGECIGKGGSGRVKIAKHAKTGQLAAVKILPTAPIVQPRASYAELYAASNHRLFIEKEITTLKLMKHPNIVRIYDVYENNTDLYIVLEYVEGGELFDYLINNGRLDEDTTWAIFRQIIYGLNYAHTFSIIHRDLKLENILMASIDPPLVKIVDWGMATFAHPSLVLETSCGSPHYVSPEIANGDPYQGTASDIWSCGVILYTLLVGYLPFDGEDSAAVIRKVMAGRYDVPSDINPQIQDLLSRMLVIDAQHRISMADILVHPWVAAPRHGHHLQIYQWPASLLPPSPSQLARPIAFKELVDPELFQSLRIIWGRHSDTEGKSIIRDLCSPPGYGEHAKAFYYLLGNYREEVWRHCSEDNLSDNDNNSQPNTLRRAPSNINLSPRPSGIDEKTCVTQSEPIVANYPLSWENSAFGSCRRQASTISSVSMSPHGRRALVGGYVSRSSLDHLPQKGLKEHKSCGAFPKHPPSKGDSSQSPRSSERFPKDMQRSGLVRASATTYSPLCSNDDEDKKNLRRYTSTYFDKENSVPEGWTMIDVEDARDFIGGTSAKNKIFSTKSRLKKPLPLEFLPIRRRKSSTSPMDIIHSFSHFNFPPPVGELKGWFSSLFCWKARSGTLLSHQDLSRTCAEVRKTLEELGGRVEHSWTEARPDCQTLKCRIGYSHDLVMDKNLKPTRFRVELSMPSPAVSYQIPIRRSTFPDKPYDNSSYSPGAKNLQSNSHSRSQERQLCHIVLVHEKGSTSAFKTILNKFKQTYSSESIELSDDTPDLAI